MNCTALRTRVLALLYSWVRTRVAQRITVLLVVVCSLSVVSCGSETTTSPPAPHAAKSNPSALFTGNLPEYAQQLDGSTQSQLKMLRAIRRIDPCSLVPHEKLRHLQPVSLTLYAPGDALDACQLFFTQDRPDEKLEVSLETDSDRSSGNESFSAQGHTIYQGRSGDSARCSYFFDSGIAHYEGAPRDVADIKIVVRTYRHDNSCALARTVVTFVAQASDSALALRTHADPVVSVDTCDLIRPHDDSPLATTSVDIADTTAYHCGLLIEPEEKPLWVELRRLPKNQISSLPQTTRDSHTIWVDASTKPLATILEDAVSGTPLQKTSVNPPRNPSATRCTAYLPVPTHNSSGAWATYLVVGGNISCALATQVVSSASPRLSPPTSTDGTH